MGRQKLNLTPEEQKRKEELRRQYKAAWAREYYKQHKDRVLKAHIKYSQKTLDNLTTTIQEQ